MNLTSLRQHHLQYKIAILANCHFGNVPFHRIAISMNCHLALVWNSLVLVAPSE
jgi:hypothetical protein